jgi:putative FmdB family regulatory protein
MPIFEYACHDCGQQFETLVRSGTVPECPSCHSTELDKQLSVFAAPGSMSQAAPLPAMGPCGTCGHPEGPGSCSVH